MPNRIVSAKLGVLDKTDDPSILQACVSALKGGPVDAVVQPTAPTTPPLINPGIKRSNVSAEIKDQAEDAIEASLKQLVNELRKSGIEPKFDGSQWGEQLIELWRTLKQLEAEGFQIEAEEVPDLAAP